MKRLLFEHQGERLGDVNCFPLSMSLCRVGIFSSVLVLLDGVGAWDVFLRHAAERSFTPKGLARWLGELAISPEFMGGLYRVAVISTIAAIAGFLTRIALPVSVVSSCLVFGVVEGYTAHWSHGRNVCLLAAIPFAFAHGAGYLSLDKGIDLALKSGIRWRGWSFFYGERQHWWPILLAQFSVAFMFFDAACHKLYQGGWKLAWILSDNLRNILAKKYLVWNQNLEISSVVEFLMRHEMAWKLAAFGAVFFQLSCIVGSFFPRYPWLRLYSAVSYLNMIVGLNCIMMMANWSRRLPLLIVFLNVEYFWARWRARERSPSPAVLLPPAGPRRAKLRWLFVGGFVGYSVFIGVIPNHKDFTATYPFTGYNPYSVALVRRPVWEHQDYVFPESYYAKLRPRQTDGYEALELFGDARVRGAVRAVARGGSVYAIDGAFRQVFERMKRYRVEGHTPGSDQLPLLAVYRAERFIPGYPASPKPGVRRRSLLAVGDKDGLVLTVSCKERLVGNDIVAVEVRPIGYQRVELRTSLESPDGTVRSIATRRTDWGLELVEPVPWTVDRFQLRIHVTELGETPFQGVEWVYRSDHPVRGGLPPARD